MTQCAMVENWLPVVDHEDRAEVSDLGRVWMIRRRTFYKDQTRSRMVGGYFKKLTEFDKGYAAVSLPQADGRNLVFLVHKLVMHAFVGPRPVGLIICHNDGDPSNNRLSNLRYDTYASNNFDAVGHGTHYWANKDRCPKGHRYVESNLLGNRQRRDCLACSRSQSYIYYHSARGHSTPDRDDLSDAIFADLINGGSGSAAKIARSMTASLSAT